jgi:multiple sugar transport system permease protein
MSLHSVSQGGHRTVAEQQTIARPAPAAVEFPQARTSRLIRRHGTQLIAYIALTLAALISLGPFIWMVSTSLKGAGQLFAWPPQLIPNPIMWDTYPRVFDIVPFGRFFLNTVFYAFAVTIGQLTFCSTAGYAFARLRFPGRDLLFMLYLGTLMIPVTVTLVPSFILMRWFHWVNTPWAMTIPGMLGGAFGTFLMRQFFLTIPAELDDAATIDGANRFRIFWQINLPLAKPGLAVLALFTVTYVWNDFLWPLVMLHDQELYTLTLGLNAFRGGIQSQTFWAELMAGATMAVGPLILLFLFTQRFFREGISFTGTGGR